MPTDSELERLLLKRLRNPALYTKKILEYVSKNVPDAFNIACRKGLSIDEWKPDSSFTKSGVAQKTVFVTVRMFDLWETAIVDVLSEELKPLNIKVKHTHDAVGDLTFVFPSGETSVWELKSSQAKDSFTGATHSASKCDNYILINYGLNKKLKLNLTDNTGFVNELAVLVWKDMDIPWSGEPSKHSSWTTLKIPVTAFQRHPEIIVVGKLEPSRKNCRILREVMQ